MTFPLYFLTFLRIRQLDIWLRRLGGLLLLLPAAGSRRRWRPRLSLALFWRSAVVRVIRIRAARCLLFCFVVIFTVGLALARPRLALLVRLRCRLGVATLSCGRRLLPAASATPSRSKHGLHPLKTVKDCTNTAACPIISCLR